MTRLTKAELALENVLRAQAELQDYVSSGASNREDQQRLAEAARVAIDECINVLAAQRPEKRDFDDHDLMGRSTPSS